MYYEGDGKHLIKRYQDSVYTVQFNVTDQEGPEAQVIYENENRLRKVLVPMV